MQNKLSAEVECMRYEVQARIKSMLKTTQKFM